MEYRELDREEFKKRMPQIIDLHDQCFGPGMTEEYFSWRYLNGPMDDLFVHVAMDGDALAAFYAVSPLLITCGEAQYRAVLSLNTMTSPDYRGMGLFPRLANDTMEHLRQEGYKAVIGFSNVHSNYIFNQHIGFSTVYEVPMLELPLEGQTYRNRSLEFDDRFEGQHFREQFGGRLRVKKSPEYLRWRYADSPEAQYHNLVLREGDAVLAYAVSKRWRDRLNLVEFHGATPELEAELLERCIQYAIGESCQYLTVWAPVNTPRHHLFERKKFINRYPIHYFVVKQLDDAPGFPDMLDSRSWELQLGDNNTY